MASIWRLLQSPIRDRSGRFSPLKAATLALILLPPVKMALGRVVGHGNAPVIYYVFWTGLWSTGAILISLAITPARRIFGLPQLILIRRMVGLAGLVYAIAHFLLYFPLHRYQLTYLLQGFSDPSLDIALVSTLGFVALGATSLDSAVAFMGARKWNLLHALIYPLAALALIHYLLSPDSLYGLPFLMSGIFFYLMAWRLLDGLTGRGAQPRALFLLALGVTAFSLGFEILWLLIYQKVSAADTLAYAFNFQFDPDSFDSQIAPVWQLLILTLIPASLPTALARHGAKLGAKLGLAATSSSSGERIPAA